MIGPERPQTMSGDQAGGVRRAKTDRTGPRGPGAAPARRRRQGPSDLHGIIPDQMPPKVRSAVMALMDELDRLKSELVEANQRVSQLENVADEDPLLPILNRRGFERELGRILAYVKRYGTTVTLLYLDLDDFKAVNDVYGHAGGDAALKHFTGILLANIRESDLVGRLGGDEFAIVLHRADLNAAAAKANKLAEQVAHEPALHEGRWIRLGVTAGATALDRDDTVASVLERADRAMYEGKMRRRAAKAGAA